MAKRPSTAWTRHLKTPKEIEDFESTLKRSSFILGRLKTLLKEWQEELERQEGKVEDYDSPSWAFKQASRNGEKHQLRKVQDLLAFLEE